MKSVLCLLVVIATSTTASIIGSRWQIPRIKSENELQADDVDRWELPPVRSKERPVFAEEVSPDVKEVNRPYAPSKDENSCLRPDEDCQEVIDSAKELIGSISDLWKSSSSDSSTTTSMSMSLAIGNFSATTTSTFTYGPTPNDYTAGSVRFNSEQLALFDADEQRLYHGDPMCFFVNIEYKYAQAAKSVTTISSAPTPTPTPQALLARQTASVTSSSQSQLDPVSAYAVQKELFETFLPQQLLQIYSPASNTSGTVYTIQTRACSRLHGPPTPTLITPVWDIASIAPEPRMPSPSPSPSSGTTGRAGDKSELWLVTGAVAMPLIAGLFL